MNRPWLTRILLAILAVYTLIEFYPFSLSLYQLPHYLVTALCLAWLLIYPDTRFITAQNLKPVLFLGLWLIYNMASYAWAKDGAEVLRYTVWILRYLALFLIYSKLFSDPRLLKRFHWFLFGLVLLYVATSIWEMLTLSHLEPSRLYGKVSFVPTASFYGENILAAFLLLFSPFLLFVPKLTPGKGLGIASAVTVVVIMGIMTIQGARIAMMGLGVLLVAFFIFQVRWRHKLALVAALTLVLGGIYLNFKKDVDLFWSLLQYQAETLQTEQGSIYMSSIQIRQQLLKESFDMAAATGFIGVGGGNYEPQMRGEAIYRTAGITNPHNYLMELFGNWGILILAGFVYLYLHWLIRLWRLWRGSRGRQRTIYLMYLWSLALFLPVSILPSTIRWQYFVWIYFAAVNATANGQPAPAEEAE